MKCICCKSEGAWTHWLIEKKRLKRVVNRDGTASLVEVQVNEGGIICDECHKNPYRFVESGIRPRFTFRRSRNDKLTGAAADRLVKHGIVFT